MGTTINNQMAKKSINNSFIKKIIKFPLFKGCNGPWVSLNSLQKEQILNFNSKVETGEYKLIENRCLCGNKDAKTDEVVIEKDRYGIPFENVLCNKCGLIRSNRKLDKESTESFYKNEYRDIYVGREIPSSEFFQDQKIRGDIFYELLKSKIDLSKVKQVFEVGCGAGGILDAFSRSGAKVSGCDFDKRYLEYGNQRNLNLYFGEVDYEKTPKGSQDLVILSHVMEHFTETIPQLNSTIELISDGGYLLVEVPGIFAILNICFNPVLYFQNAHVFNYYYYYLKVFFEQLGLKVIYGNERCTFILQKPDGWVRNDNAVIYHPDLFGWVEKVEIELKRAYLMHVLKLNPYYYKRLILKILIPILDFLGIKNVLKRALGR